MGLVEETAAGMWRIAPDLEPTLRRMGERGDIIKTMYRELKAAGIERAASDHVIFDPASDGRVVGRLVAEGFSDELRERRYVIVDGVDGRTHRVELGFWNADDAPLVRNTIMELRAREIAPRAVDRTIVEIASRNHGLYSIGLHGAADPGAEFIQTHVRRLAAMRRQIGRMIFSLVPWRPVLERAKGQSVTGVVGGEGISWSIGQKRGFGSPDECLDEAAGRAKAYTMPALMVSLYPASPTSLSSRSWFSSRLCRSTSW
jgi:Protein of unknown function (DUF3363)